MKDVFTKALLVFVVVVGLAGCSSDTPEQKACKEKCPIEIGTVCGSDGKSYDNSCLATCAKVSFNEGECKVKPK